MITESNTTKALLIATITATGLTSNYDHTLELPENYKNFDNKIFTSDSHNQLFSASYNVTDETTALFWENNAEGLFSSNYRENFSIDTNGLNTMELAKNLFNNSIYLDEEMESALSKTMGKIGKINTSRKDRL